jgi:hypothetical protein
MAFLGEKTIGLALFLMNLGLKMKAASAAGFRRPAKLRAMTGTAG